MVRRLTIWFFVLAILAAVAYGWLTYSVVALYDPNTPKVTYLFIVEKPVRGLDFFYNHVDKSMVEKQVAGYKRRGGEMPWHMDYNWVVNSAVYYFTMDNRFMD